MVAMLERTEKRIKLTEMEDVKEFVKAAGNCDFDVDVSYNRVIIDAKSMLGVLSLDLTRELTVKYGGNNMQFENVLSKYATA
jgi:phosphocarrier protein HPr